MVIPEPEHQDHTQPCSVDHVWDRVGLKIEDRQEDLGILVLVQCVLDPFVKLRIVDMLKCTTHTFYGFSVFSLTDICFHDRLIKTSLNGLYVQQMYSFYTCMLHILDKLILTFLFMC